MSDMTNEQAIKFFEEYNCMINQSCETYKANKLAIQALKAQEEREKGCEYCGIYSNKYLGIIETEPRIFVDITGEILRLFDEDYPGFCEGFDINYCPNCGRKLGGDE